MLIWSLEWDLMGSMMQHSCRPCDVTATSSLSILFLISPAVWGHTLPQPPSAIQILHSLFLEQSNSNLIMWLFNISSFQALAQHHLLQETFHDHHSLYILGQMFPPCWLLAPFGYSRTCHTYLQLLIRRYSPPVDWKGQESQGSCQY